MKGIKNKKALIIMDVVKAFQFYLNKMVSEVSGMKVLLLDSETVSKQAIILFKTCEECKK